MPGSVTMVFRPVRTIHGEIDPSTLNPSFRKHISEMDCIIHYSIVTDLHVPRKVACVDRRNVTIDLKGTSFPNQNSGSASMSLLLTPAQVKLWYPSCPHRIRPTWHRIRLYLILAVTFSLGVLPSPHHTERNHQGMGKRLIIPGPTPFSGGLILWDHGRLGLGTRPSQGSLTPVLSASIMIRSGLG